MSTFEPERIHTVVIGGGQAGLSVGYHLRKRGIPFVILDAGSRIGDAWRNRWDSLRLFTPARGDGLDGMPYPAPGDTFPTKDEMADYLEAYADRFDLPVNLDTRVDRLSRKGERFMVAAGDDVYEADNVVVAMAGWQEARVPALADELDPTITQVTSDGYRRPSQLPGGDVLVVGAANSGVEIALDVAGHRPDRTVWLAGREPGHVPFDIESWFGRHIGTRIVFFLFHNVMKRTNRLGRKVIAKNFGKGMPLVRTKQADLHAAGIERLDRIESVDGGRPVDASGTVVDPDVVVWACGFDPGFSWIDIDILEGGYPRHRSGIVDECPGLYFVGLPFLHAISSHTIHGVGRDAERVVDDIAARSPYGTAIPAR